MTFNLFVGAAHSLSCPDRRHRLRFRRDRERCRTRILVGAGRIQRILDLADGITTAEKDTVKDVNGNTSSEVQGIDGTWLVCWRNMGLQGMLNTRNAIQALSPQLNERYALSMSTSYDPNGPHHLTVYAAASRSTSGTPWSVTVVIDGVPQATQPCSSGSASCTATASAYLTPFPDLLVSLNKAACDVPSIGATVS